MRQTVFRLAGQVPQRARPARCPGSPVSRSVGKCQNCAPCVDSVGWNTPSAIRTPSPPSCSCRCRPAGPPLRSRRRRSVSPPRRCAAGPRPQMLIERVDGPGRGHHRQRGLERRGWTGRWCRQSCPRASTSAQASVRQRITAPFTPSEASRRPPSRYQTATTQSVWPSSTYSSLPGIRVPDSDGPIIGTRRDMLLIQATRSHS